MTKFDKEQAVFIVRMLTLFDAHRCPSFEFKSPFCFVPLNAFRYFGEVHLNWDAAISDPENWCDLWRRYFMERAWVLRVRASFHSQTDEIKVLY